jgi:threonine synthase
MSAAAHTAPAGPPARSGPDSSPALAAVEVRCMACGAAWPGDRPLTACPTCGGLLDVVVPVPGPIAPDALGRGLPEPLNRSGVWRYRPLLPAIPDHAVVSRWEGNTPLYRDDRLAAFAGLDGGLVRVKHEGHNPTASFKDRGMTVGVSHAKAVGARIVACASTGNTSASLASYAAAAGLPSLVLVPDGKISGGKLAQTVAYGARVVQIAGDFDVALALLRELTAAWDVYLVNSVNPFRLEGQKTILFETMEQLGWAAPDYVVLPGGNLGNTAAFGKALVELRQAGLIDRVPRLVVAQAAGSAPFAAYFRGGWDRFEAVQAETVATAIKIGNPASTPRARRAVEFSRGTVVSVSDEEILGAKAEIDRVGIGCEPASATSLAGLRHLVADGTIPPGSSAVCVLTGHVLKDADAVVNYHFQDHAGAPRPGANRPVRVEASLAALERTLADALHG